MTIFVTGGAGFIGGNYIHYHLAKDLGLDDPELYLDAVGADLGETMGNIIAASYKAMAVLKPDTVLVLGDTNSCLSVIGDKRLHMGLLKALKSLVTSGHIHILFEKRPECLSVNVV